MKNYINTILLVVILVVIMFAAVSFNMRLHEIEQMTVQKFNDTTVTVSDELSHFFHRFNEEKEKAVSLFLEENSFIDYEGVQNEKIPVHFRAIPKTFDPTMTLEVITVDGKYTADDVRFNKNGIDAVFYIPMDEERIVPMVTFVKGNQSQNEVFSPIEINWNIHIDVKDELDFLVGEDQLTIKGQVPFSFRPVYDGESTMMRYVKTISLKIYKNDVLFLEEALPFDLDTNEIMYETFYYPRVTDIDVPITGRDKVKVEAEVVDNLGIKWVKALYQYKK